ncbi:cytochrome P450 2E1-like isoform X2 [Symsagittifera roscoffensis]
MEKLHSKYGPLISLSVAGDQIWDVWFRDYEIAKEVWNDPRFSSRSIVPLAAKLELERGVSFTSGADSRSKRTMLFKVFKALGVFDKSVFSVGVEKEVELMMNYLDTMTEKNLFIQEVMSFVTNNSISKLLFNFSLDDNFDSHRSSKRNKDLMKLFELFNPTKKHWYLPFVISRHLFETKQLIRLRGELFHFIVENYNKRVTKMKSERGEPECVSDILWEKFDYFRKSASEKPFLEEDIPYILWELYLAGQESTIITLTWAVLNMIHFPDVQEKVYQELKRMFPSRDQIISLNEAMSCDYLMATIHESQRFTPTSYTTIDHMANETVENFHGYRIPKGTRMMSHNALNYKNGNYFKYPLEFNPRNFLNDSEKYARNEHLTSFATGLRACPGQHIARTELFLVLANLLRRFKICPAEFVPPLEAKIGITTIPPYFQAKLVQRAN